VTKKMIITLVSVFGTLRLYQCLKGDGMNVDEYKSKGHKFLQHAHISMPKVGEKTCNPRWI
jgi:hypothetical protein